MAQLPSRQELKRELVARGFEPFRTLGDAVVLADRVRDNLIMDSGVSAGVAETLFVRVVFHAEEMAFPGEEASHLLVRARELARPLLSRGYREVGVAAVPIRDPGDRSQILDTWHEVTFVRTVHSLEELVEELRIALPIEKTAGPGPRS
ncbi:MAG: hypothetical protein JW751_32585 [Polyangiaceae bacterium]|nr:hypothetical protein [Polyangiaceae bacterium]